MAKGAARLRPRASVVAPTMKPPWLLSSEAFAHEASWNVAHRRRPGEMCGKMSPSSGSRFKSATHSFAAHRSWTVLWLSRPIPRDTSAA
eukprot:8788146-Alexandrium_andersonii.AAC.1